MAKTVFISSTYTDLASYRRAIWTLLEQFNVSVMGMEAFGARKEAPLTTCLVELDQSDIYVGVIGFRLGSVHPDTGKSFTQMEYDHAVKRDREILIYLMDESNALVPASMVDRGPDAEKLERFKEHLKANHTVDFFRTEDDLVSKLKRDLGRLLQVRSVAATGTAEFEDAATTLWQFSLAPKSVTGREVLLRTVRKGEPFPASQALCSAFNLEYGNTVGLPVEIALPAGFSDIGLSKIYASGKRVEEFLALTRQESFEIWATPVFSPEEVADTRASFKSEGQSGRSGWEAMLGLQRIGQRKSEGTIGLLFSGTVREEDK